MSAEMARMGLRAPVNVTWEITTRCNLSCVHCLSNSGEAQKDELSSEECRRLVDQLTALKVFQVNIGGGEPFIRKDFLDLLQYCHEKALVTCVSTNGMLIDNELAGRLAKMKMLYLQLSLDGATAEINDPIRGEGTHARILQAAECLKRNQVPFSFNMVLTRQNYHQLDTVRDLAAGFGAELRVSRFRPSGRGKDSRSYLSPDSHQLETFAAWLEDHDLVRTGDSFFCLTSEKRRRKGLDMCGAAKMTCCISPSGEVYPCAFLQEDLFSAGNVRDQSFQLMWKQAPVFSELRNLSVASCKTCLRFESCRGGCPAMAYHTYQSISMPDPECLINLKTVA
jgi:mycofactocin radical SAM maturase